MEAEAFLKRVRARVAAALKTRLNAGEEVARAVDYALFPGGKRLRPAVVFASGEVVSLEGESVERIACAAELIHTASLILDDLPSMDDSSERRGKRAVHVAFGEAMAILASDALIVGAFGLCAEMPRVLRALAVGVTAMIGGQASDLRLKSEAGREEIEEAERRKTAPLFQFCAEAPALAAGAEPEVASALAGYGETLGRLFQLTDDLLDLEHGGPNLARVLGREAALESARSLCDEACSKMGPLGERAAHLCSLARLVLARAT